MGTDCLFCRIIAGEVPAEIVHRDEIVVAIVDANPQAAVHCLVLPREHIPVATDLGAAHGALLARMFEVATKIARERGLERGHRLVVNVGPEGGQTVYHLHLHVLGGRPMRWPPG